MQSLNVQIKAALKFKKTSKSKNLIVAIVQVEVDTNKKAIQVCTKDNKKPALLVKIIGRTVPIPKDAIVFPSIDYISETINTNSNNEIDIVLCINKSKLKQEHLFSNEHIILHDQSPTCPSRCSPVTTVDLDSNGNLQIEVRRLV